ncbi:hypothetical protein JCM8547_003504 [Rhodosporidiobolus lusitaniae]
MFEPVAFSLPSPPHSPPRPLPVSSSTMRNFVFPPPYSRPVPSRPLTSSSPNPDPSSSVFRLDRPHALPASYLAATSGRDSLSLSQQQIDALTADLAAILPDKWAQSSVSPAASPSKQQEGGAPDPEAYARERRLSGLLSGLGMVLGSLSLSAGAPLLAQDEDSAGEPAAEREERAGLVQEQEKLRSEDPSPASTRTFLSASSSAATSAAFDPPLDWRPPHFHDDAPSRGQPDPSPGLSAISGGGDELFESADEGEERSWVLPRRPSLAPSRTSSSGGGRSRRASLNGANSNLATIVDTSPLVPNSALVGDVGNEEEDREELLLRSPEVSFGYAFGSPVAGLRFDDNDGGDEGVRREDTVENGEEEFDEGAEADVDNESEEGSPSSVGALVRRSWRLSRDGEGGGRGALPRIQAPGKKAPVRVTEKHDDGGLGINLELLNFGGEGGGGGGGGGGEGTVKRPGVLRSHSSYQPSSRPLQARPSVIATFTETSQSPVSASPVSPHLPTSPPLAAGLATPSIAATPSISPSASFVSTTPSFLVHDPSVNTPLSPGSTSTARSPQPPRTSSLAATSSVLGTSHISSSHQHSVSRKTSNESTLGRRKSILVSSKSSKRLSQLITSGFEKVRARSVSHNSADGDEGKEPPAQEARAMRRRSKTDGPISAPLPSQPFPPGPPIRRAATPPARSSSTLPFPATSARPSLAPSAAATPSLTQSPLTGRTWRSTLTDDEFEQLSLSFGTLEMRRQEVVWELCETERSFVNGLRGVIQVFTLPLRTRSGAWIKGVPVPVSRLLDWLDDIVYLHSQISSALDSAREAQYPVIFKLAEAFLPFVARLEVHQPYLVRFESVTRSIDEMTADPDSDFGEFVRMQSSLPECGALSLSSFLLKPVQRLMKYPLFFKQLCDLTPATHPDHFSTLTLLHSTDSMIRVMQEVKTREDEYEEAKVLQSRIRGLPEGFNLAARDRRLVAHGVLRRVHINDRDRGVLEMDAMARAGRRGAALRGGAPLPPSLSIPTPSSVPSSRQGTELSRPISQISDSGSSATTYNSDVSSSSGWTPPTTPGSVLPGSGLNGFPQLRPDSMVSNASSVYSDDYLPPPGGGSAFSNASARTQTALQQRLVKTKAKESSVHVFVFSDLIVLATKHAEPGKFMRTAAAKGGTMGRKGSLGAEKKDKGEAGGTTYRALEGVGVARVLGVSDLSGKTEHDHLIEIDLLPLLKGQHQFTPLSLSNTALATAIYFTLSSPSSSRSPSSPSSDSSLFSERLRWLQAFERSYLFALRSLSFPSSALNAYNAPLSPTERLSRASYISAGILPKSPSEQALEATLRKRVGGKPEEPDPAQLEREERGFWAVRLKKVKEEVEGNALHAPAAHGGQGWPGAAGGGGGGGGGGKGRKPAAGGGTVRGPRGGAGGANPGLGIDSLGMGKGQGQGRRASG